MNEVEQMTSRDHWAEDQKLPLSCLEHIYDSAALESSTHENVVSVESEPLPPGYFYSVPVGEERFVQGLPKKSRTTCLEFSVADALPKIGSKLRDLWSHFHSMTQ